ncbi:hypothetical protein M9458_054530, partial [Cirrhinus mrigala]
LELIGTLSTVLKGPAQSWWKAEKAKVTDWQSSKKAFMAAFLSDDYLAEVEEKLRTLVQQPQQRLRDFAYDYRALCLKWKPEISEEELVNRILININPRVAGCLRGTVNTVEQLVKVGSLVEKDCMGEKDYWQKVGTQGSRDKTKKSADRTNNKNLAGVTLAQPHPLTSLLVVPVKVPAGPVTPSAQPHSLTAAKLNLYYALPPTGRLPELMSFTPEVPQWDSDNQDELLKLISAWPCTTSNILGKTSVVQHKITLTDDIPLKSRAYRVSPIKKQIIEQHVDQMLQDNIIEPSFSPWSSPVVLVPKPDGSYRFCVDYRKLNRKTVPDAYPMPLIHDILESLEGASWFSALDLQSGNSAATFQHLMERVLADLTGKICFVYIDDIIIYSKTLEQHIQHLNTIFHKLTQANLTLNMKKCHFFKRQLKFLGHVVSERGVEIDREKTRAVAEFPPPQDLKALQRFLGLAGWYHKFIPHFADIAAPLNHLKKKGVKWEWTSQCQNSMDALKQALQNSPVLIQPDLNKTFQVHTDASDVGLGAILTQHTVEGEKTWGCVRRLTTSYHPQANLTERINRTVKTMIAVYVGQQHQAWDQWLPEFRYAIKTAQQESTGKTPAELMLGRQVLGPLERLIHRPPSPDQAAYSLVERQNIMAEEIKSRMRMSQAKQAKYYNYRRKNAQFQPGDLVWLKTHPLSSASNKFSAKLAPKWEGPAEIKSKTGPINYTVCWGNPPETDVINVVNLKRYYGCLPPTP